MFIVRNVMYLIVLRVYGVCQENTKELNWVDLLMSLLYEL